MIAPEVTEAAGITYRVLDYWTRRGYVLPAFTTAQGSDVPTDRDPVSPGSGSSRHYSDAEVAVCVRMAVLVRSGFAPPAAAVIARNWLETGDPHYELSGGLLLLCRDAGLATANIPVLTIMALVVLSLLVPMLPPNPVLTAVLMAGVTWCGWQLARWLRGRSWIREAA